MQEKNIVMVFGTFDLFHEGHKFYIKNSLKFGSKIIVVIARDNRVKKIKNIIPNDNENERQKNIQNFLDTIGGENIAILGDENNIFAPIEKFDPDILCFGYDQNVPEEILQKKFPNIKTFRIASYKPEKYKSSIIRQKLFDK